MVPHKSRGGAKVGSQNINFCLMDAFRDSAAQLGLLNSTECRYGCKQTHRITLCYKRKVASYRKTSIWKTLQYIMHKTHNKQVGAQLFIPSREQKVFSHSCFRCVLIRG